MRRILAIAAVFSALLCGAALADSGAPPGMPANVQAIMKRLESGIPPTPAEQKILKNYLANAASSASAGAGATTGGAAASNRGMLSASAASGGINPHQPTMTSSGTFTVGSGMAQNPCKPAGKAVGLGGAAPSRDAYVAMAKDAMRTYRAHLTSDAQGSLNTVLTQSFSANLGAGAAAILVIHGNGSAAVVSAAYAAEKLPTDPVTANNLGAILRGMHDYARAAIALQYARSLAPNSAVIANNLGWLAMGQGDSRTAGTLFAVAVKNNAKMSTALLGQGLIDQCSGKSAQALPLFRASMANGFSDLAEAGISSADNDLANANQSSQDNASPDVYGQSSSGDDMPNWQDPPFDSDPTKFVSDYEAKPSSIRAYIDTYMSGIENDAVNAEKSLGPKIKGASTTGTGRSLTFARGNAKQAFEISDILGIIGRDSAAIDDKFSTDVANDIPRDGCHSCAGETPPINPPCSAAPQFRSIHAGVSAEEPGEWTKLRKTIQDVYGFTDPLIAQIRDANQAKVEDASRRIWAVTAILGFTSEIPLWQGEGYIAMNPPLCGSSASKPFVAQALKPFGDDPTQCKSGSMSLKFGFANLDANCDKMTLTIGEGLVGAATWKFAPDYTKMSDGSLRPTGTDWSNDQISIFVGAGASGSGPLTGNVAAGGYVTIQNGAIIDGGGQAQAGVTVGNGAVTPATGQAGATAQISVISGPDVTTSSGVRVGGNCGVSC